MPRRLVATIALWAVFLSPISALWCAYTCAEDDDSASAVVAAAPSLANPSSMGMGARAAAGQLAIAAHDDCAADVSNTATRAVVQGRARYGVSWVVSPAAEPLRALAAGAGPDHPFWLMTSRGSPPGALSFSVLRI